MHFSTCSTPMWLRLTVNFTLPIRVLGNSQSNRMEHKVCITLFCQRNEYNGKYKIKNWGRLRLLTSLLMSSRFDRNGFTAQLMSSVRFKQMVRIGQIKKSQIFKRVVCSSNLMLCYGVAPAFALEFHLIVILCAQYIRGVSIFAETNKQFETLNYLNCGSDAFSLTHTRSQLTHSCRT